MNKNFCGENLSAWKLQLLIAVNPAPEFKFKIKCHIKILAGDCPLI